MWRRTRGGATLPRKTSSARPDSLEDNRSNFALRDTFVRVSPAFRRGYLTAGVNLGYLDPSIGSGTDKTMPSTDEIFEPAEVPGLETQPAFGVIEPFVEFATLDRASRIGLVAAIG